MTPLIRIAFIVVLFAIAIAQAAFGIANAQPSTPSGGCDALTACRLVPAGETIVCPPPGARPQPCHGKVTPAHVVCTKSSVCRGP